MYNCNCNLSKCAKLCRFMKILNLAICGKMFPQFQYTIFRRNFSPWMQKGKQTEGFNTLYKRFTLYLPLIFFLFFYFSIFWWKGSYSTLVESIFMDKFKVLKSNYSWQSWLSLSWLRKKNYGFFYSIVLCNFLVFSTILYYDFISFLFSFIYLYGFT